MLTVSPRSSSSATLTSEPISSPTDPMFSYIMRSRVQMMKLMSQFEGLVAAMEDLQVQDAEEGDDGRKGEGVQEGEGDKLKLEGKDADEEDGHTPNANFEGKE